MADTAVTGLPHPFDDLPSSDRAIATSHHRDGVPIQTEPRTLRSDLGRLRRRVLAEGAGQRARTSMRQASRRTSTGTRVLMAGAAAFVPLVIVAFVLAGSLSRAAALTADVRDGIEGEIAPILQLSEELAEAGTLVDRYFASGSSSDLAAVRSQVARADLVFDGLLAGADPADARAQARLKSAGASWDFLTQTVSAGDFARPEDEAARAGLQATFADTLSRVRGDLGEVTTYATGDIVALTERAQDQARFLRSLLWVTVVLATLLGLWLVASLRRDLVRATAALVEGTDAVRAGNFAHRIREDVPGELAPVASAFNAMAERIERQNEELHGLANHDPLTGVHNRRSFETELRAEFERSARYGRSTALLLLDIDHFKKVNDQHGHPAGDVVLKAVADEILAAVRGLDTVARWGGEEFAILLPETEDAAARHVAKRINQVIGERVVLTDGVAIRVTASIGMARTGPGVTGIERPEDLVQRADRALYTAKDRGRNRVVVAGTG